MTLWPWVLGACLAAYLIKLAGYLLPQSLLDRPVSRIDLRAAGRMAVSVNPQLAGAPYEWRRGV